MKTKNEVKHKKNYIIIGMKKKQNYKFRTKEVNQIYLINKLIKIKNNRISKRQRKRSTKKKIAVLLISKGKFFFFSAEEESL